MQKSRSKFSPSFFKSFCISFFSRPCYAYPSLTFFLALQHALIAARNESSLLTLSLMIPFLHEVHCCCGSILSIFIFCVTENVWLAAVPPCVGFAGWLFCRMDCKPFFLDFYFLSSNMVSNCRGIEPKKN